MESLVRVAIEKPHLILEYTSQEESFKVKLHKLNKKAVASFDKTTGYSKTNIPLNMLIHEAIRNLTIFNYFHNEKKTLQKSYIEYLTNNINLYEVDNMKIKAKKLLFGYYVLEKKKIEISLKEEPLKKNEDKINFINHKIDKILEEDINQCYYSLSTY